MDADEEDGKDDDDEELVGKSHCWWWGGYTNEARVRVGLYREGEKVKGLEMDMVLVLGIGSFAWGFKGRTRKALWDHGLNWNAWFIKI